MGSLIVLGLLIWGGYWRIARAKNVVVDWASTPAVIADSRACNDASIYFQSIASCFPSGRRKAARRSLYFNYQRAPKSHGTTDSRSLLSIHRLKAEFWQW